MNPLIGVPPNQINKDDPMVSNASKWEHAKAELAYCLYNIDIQKDSAKIEKLEKRFKNLQNYMIELEETSKRKEKGCYIATHLYGNYNHPKVKILRVFRDTVLDKSMIGSKIISYYYKYSPKLVNKMEGRDTLNKVSKTLLELIVCFIKKII